MYLTETALIKISLLLQYLRIFKDGAMRRICIAMLVIVSLWGLGFAICGWFPCSPIRGFYKQDVQANCYGFGLHTLDSFAAMFKAHSSTNMAFDVIIFLMPLVLFSTPHLKLKNLISMTGVFFFGGV